MIIVSEIYLSKSKIKTNFGGKRLNRFRPRFKCTNLINHEKKIKIFDIRKVKKILSAISER